MNKLFEKMYKDLVMTNYFIYRYNTRLIGSDFDILDEKQFSLDVPN